MSEATESKQNTLLVSVLAIVLGGGVGAGASQLSLPDMERRVDQNKDEITELRLKVEFLDYQLKGLNAVRGSRIIARDHHNGT